MSERRSANADELAEALRAVAGALGSLSLSEVSGPGQPAAGAGGGAGLFAVNNYHIQNVHVTVGSLGAPAPAAAAGGPAGRDAARTPCGAGCTLAEEPACEPGGAEFADADDGGGHPAARGRAREEPWVYALWCHPSRLNLRGVHVGGGLAWEALQRTLPNERYSYSSGARLRRFESEEEGVAAYIDEAERHGAPLPPRIWRHPLVDIL
jgi:hypothetical protein